MYRLLSCKKCGEYKLHDMSSYLEKYEKESVESVRYMRCEKCMIFCKTNDCFELVKQLGNGVTECQCNDCKKEICKYYNELGEIINILNEKYHENIFYSHYGTLIPKK